MTRSSSKGPNGTWCTKPQAGTMSITTAYPMALSLCPRISSELRIVAKTSDLKRSGNAFIMFSMVETKAVLHENAARTSFGVLGRFCKVNFGVKTTFRQSVSTTFVCHWIFKACLAASIRGSR